MIRAELSSKMIGKVRIGKKSISCRHDEEEDGRDNDDYYSFQ